MPTSAPSPRPREAAIESGTRRQILERLKTQGPQDAQALAEHLQLTAMAVRQHLYAMQEAGLVSYREVPVPRGRPAKHWHLTRAAEHQFPDAHAELTVVLLENIRETFGEQGMDRLLERRAEKQREAYAAQLSKWKSLPRKLEALAEIRTAEGYMARVLGKDESPDGALYLVENHCPICDAAKTCQALCRSELALFQNVLGPGVTVERTEHILQGARRCAYRITPNSRTKGGRTK